MSRQKSSDRFRFSAASVLLSGLILLLPACAYGTGYLTGPNVRAKVHTAIKENDRRRKRREKKERRIRAGITAKPKEPEKLN